MIGQVSIATSTCDQNGAGFLSTAREEGRDRCEIEAYVIATGASDPAPCFIENISASGARIRLYDGLSLPRHCSVLIPISRDSDERRGCEVLWVAGDVVGVRFLD